MSHHSAAGGDEAADTSEAGLSSWRSFMERAGVGVGAIDAGEARLRAELVVLKAVGLADDEAFLVAVRRAAAADELTRAFGRVHLSPLWRGAGADDETSDDVASARDAVLFALVAAALVPLARLLAAWADADPSWFVQNAPWYVTPVLAGWLVRRRGLRARSLAAVVAVSAVAAVVLNAYPYVDGSSTETLATVHLPILLGAAVAVPYCGGWSCVAERGMEFVRFTGEWFVYYVLIALGGGVLMGLTGAVLVPAGVDVESVVGWVVPAGAAGAVLIAAWLVETRQRVVGGLAPLLTMLFTPLFAVMLVISAVIHAAQGFGRSFDREMLGVFDALLVVVLGLVLYSASARAADAPSNWHDRLQLVAMVAAVVLDAMVLASMVARVSDLGLTPNRVAALGLNVVLLTGLAGGAWRSTRFVLGRDVASATGRWFVAFLPALAVWAAVVAVVLPIAFSFQ